MSAEPVKSSQVAKNGYKNCQLTKYIVVHSFLKRGTIPQTFPFKIGNSCFSSRANLGQESVNARVVLYGLGMCTSSDTTPEGPTFIKQ